MTRNFPPIFAVQKSPDLEPVTGGLLRGRVFGNSVCLAGEPTRRELEKLFKKFESISGYYSSSNFDSRFDFFRAGSSSLVRRSNFTLSGQRAEEFRRALKVGQKTGLIFEEIEKSPEAADKISELEEKWKKRHHGPRIQFILSSFRYPAVTSKIERWFVVKNGESVKAFVSAIPYGKGYYFEHMIFDPLGTKMSLDFVLACSIQRLFTEGVEEISLGFNPGHIYCPKNWIESTLYRSSKLKWPYNSSGILRFKRKFQSLEVPRFLYLDKRARKLGQILNLTRSTYSFGNSTLGKRGEPFSISVPSSESPHF